MSLTFKKLNKEAAWEKKVMKLSFLFPLMNLDKALRESKKANKENMNEYNYFMKFFYYLKYVTVIIREFNFKYNQII
jgi:hypothetical protein